ncbi:MAG: single-stranded-DNA-specific exonuclease RecJ [Alphaproteobacteria bacterium]|nr:MAG: single-stranded-DNA-specific exonuclease RecJ [Alphaproteobacteria bacterium]
MLQASSLFVHHHAPCEGISALGRAWSWRNDDAALVADMVRYLQIPELLAALLAGRGQNLDSALDYLTPSLKHALPDPLHLHDMEKAVTRLIHAIESNERIVIFGDYDVDGATSTALMIHYLRAVGADVGYYIPDRHTEGYGPNSAALLKLKEEGTSLVVTVDCGAVSFAPLADAHAAGLDVIVVDHHKGAAELPKAVAVVNPNRLDEMSNYRHCAAVGVVFLLLIALNARLRTMGYFSTRSEPNLMQWLDLVAIGTICDVVSLTTLNRAYAAQGLRVASYRRNMGLTALLDHAGVHGEITAYHAGFVIGPRINAGGRVGASDLGVRLLTSENPKECAEIAAQLGLYNQERQAIEQTVLDAALAEAEKQVNAPMMCVAGDGWHAGVIGIVASRLKDRYDRPAIVIAFEGEKGKASARSVAGIDIGVAIVRAREEGIILEGGGHSMAGGFSLTRAQYDEAVAFFHHYCEAPMRAYVEHRTLKLDSAITCAMVNANTIAQLERAAPFGAGNPSGMFMLRNVRVLSVDALKEQHLRVLVTDVTGARVKAMCFRAIGTALGDMLLGSRGKTIHLAGNLKSDVWQGRTQVTFMIHDAMQEGV